MCKRSRNSESLCSSNQKRECHSITGIQFVNRIIYRNEHTAIDSGYKCEKCGCRSGKSLMVCVIGSRYDYLSLASSEDLHRGRRRALVPPSHVYRKGVVLNIQPRFTKNWNAAFGSCLRTTLIHHPLHLLVMNWRL